MKTLGDFFRAIEKDPRIGPSHICLFVCLHQLWKENSCPEALLISRNQIMQRSKILSPSTYHLLMGDLVRSGYLVYRGRFDRKGSEIFF